VQARMRQRQRGRVQHERAFVLRPLAEIAPALHLPGRGALQPLLDATAGQEVRRLLPDGTPA
jgi:2-amino-4-hydroxy-6-hydroxymethyldihydropteridine diphosphokinase